MKSVIRIIALWLMLVAVPYQGFASASMVLCDVSMPVAQMENHHDCEKSAKCSSMGDCCVAAALAYATPQAATQPQPVMRLHLAEPAPPKPVDLALPKRPPRATFA